MRTPGWSSSRSPRRSSCWKTSRDRLFYRHGFRHSREGIANTINDLLNAFADRVAEVRPHEPIPLIDRKKRRFTTRQFLRRSPGTSPYQPFGVVAGKIQYKHTKAAMFEGTPAAQPPGSARRSRKNNRWPDWSTSGGGLRMVCSTGRWCWGGWKRGNGAPAGEFGPQSYVVRPAGRTQASHTTRHTAASSGMTRELRGQLGARGPRPGGVVRKSDAQGVRQVFTAVDRLAGNPRPKGAFASADVLRIHVGIYHVMYEISDQQIRVNVIHLGRVR